MGKIIIAGPGRSGSTFLIQLMGRLGMDTGFEPYNEPYYDNVRAGCELNIDIDYDNPIAEDVLKAFEEAPKVLKSPSYGMDMKFMLICGVEIEHVIVPFRELEISAMSRIDVGLEWLLDDEEIEKGEKIWKQANILAMAFGRALEACILWSIPVTIMRFPIFIDDPEYCYAKLGPIVNVGKERFLEEFNKLARPEQIKWRRQ